MRRERLGKIAVLWSLVPCVAGLAWSSTFTAESGGDFERCRAVNASIYRVSGEIVV